MENLEEEKPELDNILHEYVKIPGFKWDGAFCSYRGFDAITTFGGEHLTAVWVRQSIPDMRENWLDAREPDFFKKLDAALVVAKEVIDESYHNQEVFQKARERLGH